MNKAELLEQCSKLKEYMQRKKNIVNSDIKSTQQTLERYKRIINKDKSSSKIHRFMLDDEASRIKADFDDYEANRLSGIFEYPSSWITSVIGTILGIALWLIACPVSFRNSDEYWIGFILGTSSFIWFVLSIALCIALAIYINKIRAGIGVFKLEIKYYSNLVKTKEAAILEMESNKELIEQLLNLLDIIELKAESLKDHNVNWDSAEHDRLEQEISIFNKLIMDSEQSIIVSNSYVQMLINIKHRYEMELTDPNKLMQERQGSTLADLIKQNNINRQSANSTISIYRQRILEEIEAIDILLKEKSDSIKDSEAEFIGKAVRIIIPELLRISDGLEDENTDISESLHMLHKSINKSCTDSRVSKVIDVKSTVAAINKLMTDSKAED